jgi:hypothetical protein
MTTTSDDMALVEKLRKRAELHTHRFGNTGFYGDADAKLDRQAASTIERLTQVKQRDSVAQSQPDDGDRAAAAGSEPTGAFKQRAHDDCTICCIAMATGLSYETVMSVASASVGGYRYRGALGTMSPKGVLLDLGYGVRRVGMEAMDAPRRELVLSGKRAILSVPSLNGFVGHHDIYWDGCQLHDPSNGETYGPDGLSGVTPTWAVLLTSAPTQAASPAERLDPPRETVKALIAQTSPEGGSSLVGEGGEGSS